MKHSQKGFVLRVIPLALLFVLLIFVFSRVSGRDLADSRNSDRSAQDGPQQPAIERLQTATNGQAIVSTNPATGVASFVRLPSGDAAALSTRSSLSATDQARAFLDAYGDVFGVQDAGTQLQLVDERRNFAGHTQLTYKQMHNGVDVFAGVLNVRVDNNNHVTVSNGMFLPRIDVDTTPSLAEETAIARAVSHVERQLGITNASSNLAATNS